MKLPLSQVHTTHKAIKSMNIVQTTYHNFIISLNVIFTTNFVITERLRKQNTLLQSQ